MHTPDEVIVCIPKHFLHRDNPSIALLLNVATQHDERKGCEKRADLGVIAGDRLAYMSLSVFAA